MFTSMSKLKDNDRHYGGMLGNASVIMIMHDNDNKSNL